ncbi:Hypothetical predicted protein [Lecanosticta acicola]|uniref:Uncharacterized protein n=1 Tax=Lecanosticta acicola TaxID=111012 RepID=A0AAI9E7C9_9PEZI|nr:Hypothetical predicted protein [Lecanosticta acicola]
MSTTKNMTARPSIGSPRVSDTSISTTSSRSSRFSLASREFKRQSKQLLVEPWYGSYRSWLAQVERDEQAIKAQKGRKNSWLADLKGTC